MFQNLLFACALTSTLGLASIKEDIKPSYKSDEVSFHHYNKKNFDYDDEDEYSVSFTADELNNYVWTNMNAYFVTQSVGLEDVGVTNVFYGGVGVPIEHGNVDSEHMYFLASYNSGDYNISFNCDPEDYQTQPQVYNKFYFYDDVDNVFTSGLDIVFGSDYSEFLEGLISAIELDIQANQAGDNMPQVLDDFVGVLTTAIGSLASGIAGGVTSMAQDLFLQDDGEGNVTGLSVFGGIVALFAGLALAVAITTKVYTWVTSLGN